MSSTAWVYLVVSSEAQADTLVDQRAWATAVAAENAWQIGREFSGVSTGKQGARKLLADLVAELRTTPKRERPERVLMIRLDRAGRGLGLEAVAALAEIHALGVMVHTREDGDVRISRVSDTIKPILRILTGALENEARSDKSREAHKRKRQQGKHAGHAPFGCVLVDGWPAPYEPEAQIVRQLFDHRIGGWGVHRLARFAIRTAPAKRRRDGTLRLLRWDESTVTRMLQCRTYRGIVVDEQVWDSAQFRSPAIERANKYPFPLRGAVRCSCGRMLSTAFTGPTGHRVRYYVCRYSAGHLERRPFHRADVLEAQFIALLGELAQDPDLLQGEPGDVSDLERQALACEATIADVDARKRRVWEMFEGESVEKADVRERLLQLQGIRQEAERVLKETHARITVLRDGERARSAAAEAVSRMAELFARATVEEQREIAKAVAAIRPLRADPPPPRKARATVLRFG